jgi:hypothetical protein
MAVVSRKDSGGRVIGYFAVVNYRGAEGIRRQVRKNAKGKTPRARELESQRIERDLLNKRDAGELKGQRKATRQVKPLTVTACLDQWLMGSPGKAK